METYPSCVQVCKGKSSLERLLLGGTSHTCNPRIWRTGIGSMWVFEFKVSPGWGHLKTKVRKNEKVERRREKKKSHTQPGLQSDILAHNEMGEWLTLLALWRVWGCHAYTELLRKQFLTFGHADTWRTSELCPGNADAAWNVSTLWHRPYESDLFLTAT